MRKRNHRIRISKLTSREYHVILESANFTDEQRELFERLNKDQYYDVALMSQMNLSSRRYYDLKSTVIDKVERIARESGFLDAIMKR